MFALHGNGVGGGIAIGKARVLYTPGQDVVEYAITDEQIAAEVERFKSAVISAQTGLEPSSKCCPQKVQERSGRFLTHIC